MDFLGEHKSKIIKGNPLTVYEKIIVPLIQISTQKNCDGEIIIAEVIPIAVLVKENNHQYLIPFAEGIEIDEDTIEDS